MKSYSELSDFEINKLVAIYLGVKPRKTISFIGQEKDIYPDYCSNPSDAWPIIIDNHITIINDSDCTRMAVSNTDDFYDENVRTGVGYYQEWNENGLRAAMIVYLMMRDGENA